MNHTNITTNHTSNNNNNNTVTPPNYVNTFGGVAYDDGNTAGVILLCVFLLLTQVLCIIRWCTTDKTHGYTQGKKSRGNSIEQLEDEEGHELVVDMSLDTDTASI